MGSQLVGNDFRNGSDIGRMTGNSEVNCCNQAI